MIPFEVVVLAVVQGIAEFLPISSSGHVVVVSALFDQLGQSIPDEEKLSLNIALHVGTLGAILVFYRHRLAALFGRDRRMIGLLLVGTLPAVAVGAPLRLFLAESLHCTLLVGWMFPLTGVILVWGARMKPGSVNCCELGYGRALWIGGFQALAVLPGISRSGASIVAGMSCGLKREEAAAFSFLLAIPVIGGAGLIEAACLIGRSSDPVSTGLLGLGVVLSFVVGLASLAWLVRWLKKGHLLHFAWWVFLLGPTVIIWQLLLG
jgi:undecaprenyl-diphosphatase